MPALRNDERDTIATETSGGEGDRIRGGGIEPMGIVDDSNDRPAVGRESEK
jgi:hypothetical protein